LGDWCIIWVRGFKGKDVCTAKFIVLGAQGNHRRAGIKGVGRGKKTHQAELPSELSGRGYREDF